MPSFRCPSVRHLTARQSAAIPRHQRRWAKVVDVRFLATQQAQERIIDRYKNKLDQKAKQEGLEDISQLKEAYKDKIKDLKKKAAVPGATAPLQRHQQTTSSSSHVSQWQQPPPPPAEPQDPSAQYKPPGVKTLSSFLDIPKTLDLPPKEIESIWRLRHAGSPQSLCAAIPTDTFSAIAATARKHPQFILPGLPPKPPAEDSADAASSQNQGAPIHFMQWNFTGPDTVTVLFTHLAEYKLRGEYAQPHTTMTHHLELAQAKGLVLCQGSVIQDRGVSIEEGKWLIMCMQKFYNTQSAQGSDDASSTRPDGGGIGEDLRKRRRRLVEKFTQGDESFKVEELLEEAERIG